MKELIELINNTFLQRTEDLSLQREIWNRLAAQFRPDISQYRNIRPSTLIARETGDLGLTVLWIVQTVLVRPILSELSLNSGITPELSAIISAIESSSICALAHSENSDNPATVTDVNGSMKLSGEKKFITAGANADLVLISCRNPGEEKISRIALLKRDSIPAGSLVDLHLDIFKSVNHSKLILNNIDINKDIIPDMEPSLLRRGIKKWGIIERALIMESFISYLIHVNRMFTEKDIIIASEEELISLEKAQSDSAGKQIDEAVYSKKVETKNISPVEAFGILQRFKEKFAELKDRFTVEEQIKLLDLNLFDNLRG